MASPNQTRADPPLTFVAYRSRGNARARDLSRRRRHCCLLSRGRLSTEDLEGDGPARAVSQASVCVSATATHTRRCMASVYWHLRLTSDEGHRTRSLESLLLADMVAEAAMVMRAGRQTTG